MGRLTKKQKLIKQKADPITKMKGERSWIYPVRSQRDKYWYPALWIHASYSWDTLLFELLYKFKYLDSGTKKKGMNEPEYFGEGNVLWDKGLIILDWNQRQRFRPLTNRDKTYKIYG